MRCISGRNKLFSIRCRRKAVKQGLPDGRWLLVWTRMTSLEKRTAPVLDRRLNANFHVRREAGEGSALS